MTDAARLRTAVLMCTHNGARHVQAQLDSVRAQQGGIDELHVFDWGSNDGTADVVSQWMTQHRGDACHSELHRRDTAPGPARSFLDALTHVVSHSNADLVFLSDQDDIWHSGKVRACVESYSGPAGPFEIAHSDARVVSETGACEVPSFYERTSPYVRPSTPPGRSMLVTNPAIGMTMCLRREWLREVAPAFGSYWIMHDWALMALAWLTGSRVRYLDVALVDYRQHASNALGASMSRSLFSKARRMRSHAAKVRRQIDSMRDVRRVVATNPAADEQLESIRGRWSSARVAATSTALRPHYRAMLAASLLVF